MKMYRIEYIISYLTLHRIDSQNPSFELLLLKTGFNEFCWFSRNAITKYGPKFSNEVSRLE